MFISLLNVKVLASSEVMESAKNAKKIVKKKPDTKVTKKASSEENSDASDKETDEESQEDEVKPRKKIVPKGKVQASVQPKKRKGEETDLYSKKKAKPVKAASEDNGDAEDSGKDSEDDQSHSSPEKASKVILNQ